VLGSLASPSAARGGEPDEGSFSSPDLMVPPATPLRTSPRKRGAPRAKPREGLGLGVKGRPLTADHTCSNPNEVSYLTHGEMIPCGDGWAADGRKALRRCGWSRGGRMTRCRSG
jgi:hypothetical protein